MSSDVSSRVWPAWLDPGKAIPGNVPPRKRQLALALRSLCRLLRSQEPDGPGGNPPKQAEAARRLNCSADMLSRYLNETRVPGREFVERLYGEASADAAASGQDTGMTREALLTLHSSAAAERRGCKHCSELSERIDSLMRQLNAPCPACVAHQAERDAYQLRRKRDTARLRSARRKAARLHAAVEAMRAETKGDGRALAAEAGPEERPAARTNRALLPVPHQHRDRQQSMKDMSAARQLVAQAGELDGEGREDLAFTLLRQSTTELLTPAETAQVLVELRQCERDRLANDLIHVFGRDQAKQDVMTVALVLHEKGATDDAGAILRAALG